MYRHFYLYIVTFYTRESDKNVKVGPTKLKVEKPHKWNAKELILPLLFVYIFIKCHEYIG